MKIWLLLLLSLNLYAQDSAFDTVDNNLTIEDEAAAQNYIHQGMADAQYREMCFEEDGRMKKICQENQFAFDGGMQVLEAMLPQVQRMYAMIVGMGGGGGFTAQNYGENGNLEVTSGRGNDATTRVLDDTEQANFESTGNLPEGTEKSTEEKSDYCSYVAIAGEAVNTAMVTIQNTKTQQNYQASKPEARQAAGFYSLAENEKTMKKGADMQSYTWGATAACYGVYAAQAQFRGDWKVYAKLAGSTLITAFYMKKAKIHKKRHELLLKMAEELPQAGDCNPYTDTSCFCAEPTSGATDPANFRKYCIPEALVARANGKGTPVPCVDVSGKADPACTCQQRKTCIDRALRMAGVDIGLDPLAMRNPLQGIAPLASGLDSGNLDAARARNLAFAENALKEFAPDDLTNINGTQKKTASDLAKFGIPKPAAMAIARTRGGSGGKTPKSMQLASLGSPGALGAPRSNKTEIVKQDDRVFSTTGGEKKRSGKSSDPFAKFRKKNRKRTSSIDIEKFASKATKEAEIRMESGRNIFDIISYRYKMSAWREFPDAVNTNEQGKEGN